MEYEEFKDKFDKLISKSKYVCIFISEMSNVYTDRYEKCPCDAIIKLYLFYKGLLIGLIDINIVKKLR